MADTTINPEDLGEEIIDGFDDEPTPDQLPLQPDEITPAADEIPAPDSALEQPAAPVKSEETPKAPVSQPVEDVDSDFPETMLRAAGMTAAEAKAQFGTPETMDAAISWHVRQIAASGRPSPMPASQPTNLPAATQPVPQAPKAQPTPATGQSWYRPFAPIAAAMKDENGDPLYAQATIDVFARQDAHMAEVLDRALASLDEKATRADRFAQQQATESQVVEQERYYAEMEKRFANLGDEWSDVFGKGDARSQLQFDPVQKTVITPPTIQARTRVAALVETIKDARVRQGLPPLSDDAAFQQALYAEHHSKLQQINQKEIQAKRASRSNLATLRPSLRKVPAGDQNRRTLAAVEQQLNKTGGTLGPLTSEDDIADGF